MISLPRLAGTREKAIELIQPLRDFSLYIDAKDNLSSAQGFVDELCKQLIEKRVDRVTFISASDKFREHFMKSHWLRSGKFLVEFV